MKINIKTYRAREGAVRLKQWPTRGKPLCKSKHHYAEILDNHVKKLSDRQGLFYADHRYSMLLIFQGMDASGKDGAIKHVMSGVNPQGCEVHSFKQPGSEDLAHDFLWRSVVRLPERGHIGIFNRSYYEEALIVRVHPELLRAQNLPAETLKDGDFWKHRFRSINDHEKHLHRNGTHVVKFFLHLSRAEQRQRFLARIDDPDKNWKFSDADVKERALWKKYTAAYEACLGATSTRHAPWYIVPADDKHNARLIISQIILDTIDGLDLRYPEVDAAHRDQLKAVRKQL